MEYVMAILYIVLGHRVLLNVFLFNVFCRVEMENIPSSEPLLLFARSQDILRNEGTIILIFRHFFRVKK